MPPEGPRGGGVRGEVGVWAVGKDRHPLDPPHHHGEEGVRRGAAELALSRRDALDHQETKDAASRITGLAKADGRRVHRQTEGRGGDQSL
jgi:hypothetical protein